MKGIASPCRLSASDELSAQVWSHGFLQALPLPKELLPLADQPLPVRRLVLLLPPGVGRGTDHKTDFPAIHGKGSGAPAGEAVYGVHFQEFKVRPLAFGTGDPFGSVVVRRNEGRGQPVRGGPAFL